MVSIVSTFGNHSSATGGIPSAPLAGDTLVLVAHSGRSTPRNAIGCTGAGGTWTKIAGASGDRRHVYICTDATTTDAFSVTWDGGTPTASCVLFHLRGLATDDAVVSTTTSGTAGPAQSAGLGQAVVAMLYGSGTTPAGSSVPSGAWTPVLAGNGSLVGAHAIPGSYATHRVDSTLDNQITQVLLGPAPVPDPPTDLAQIGATDTTLDVTWTAPATGEAPTGYEWRLDGGEIIPTAVPPASPSGLTVDTTYIFEVRSVATSGVSAWASLEVATSPPPGPQPPTGLTQTGATPAAVEVSWTAPIFGVPAEGYNVRVDGGAPVDVGLATSYEALALDPSTDYLVEVQTYADGDVSDWASVVATTTALDPVDPEVPLDWTLDVTVGGHSWTVNAGDPAGYGPLAGLRVGWAARQDDGWPTHPEPAACTFQVLTETAGELADVDLGTPVHVVFTPTAAAAPLVEFGGIVRAVTQVAHELGQVTAINALDYTVLLAEKPGPQVTTAQQTPQQRFELLENPVIIDGSLVNPPGNPYPPANTDVAAGWYPALEAQRFASVLALVHHTLARQTSPRMVLTQRLTDGLLDPVRPWEAVPAPATTIPVIVNAGLLHTQPTTWTRDRSIPNVVGYDLREFPVTPDDLVETEPLPIELERPHPGQPDIRRNLAEGDTWPAHVIAGVDGPSRWTTVLEVAGYLAPTLPAGWFTQPDAQRHELTVPNIADRHNPNAPGDYVGLLAGAELTIPPGGQWLIRATLRRVLFDD